MNIVGEKIPGKIVTNLSIRLRSAIGGMHNKRRYLISSKKIKQIENVLIAILQMQNGQVSIMQCFSVKTVSQHIDYSEISSAKF